MYSGVVIQNLKCDVLQNVSDVFSVGRVVGGHSGSRNLERVSVFRPYPMADGRNCLIVL